MPRTPAKVTQADIGRAIRAVARSGVKVGSVEVKPDGSVIVHAIDDATAHSAHKAGQPERNEWDDVLEGASP